MQTDPNWTNFLWNAQTRQVELVDFGATREYSKEFMDDWLRLLQAAASEDRDACVQYSLKLGYLTGEEKEVRSLSPSQDPRADVAEDYGRRSRQLDGSACCSFQSFYAPAVLFRARDSVGGYHRPDSGTDTRHAAASAYTTTTGDI